MEIAMTDDFDEFLSHALAPREREEDHLFVERVQAAIRIDQRLRLVRVGLVRRLVRDLLAVLTLAAGVLWLARSPAVASVSGDSLALGALMLCASFGVLVVTLSIDDGGADRLQ